MGERNRESDENEACLGVGYVHLWLDCGYDTSLNSSQSRSIDLCKTYRVYFIVGRGSGSHILDTNPSRPLQNKWQYAFSHLPLVLCKDLPETGLSFSVFEVSSAKTTARPL